MRILVTGGAGFIGSHLVDALVTARHAVTVLDDFSTGKLANRNPRAKYIRGLVQDVKTERIVTKVAPQVIFHLAAQKDVRISVERPVYDAEINVIGITRLLQGAMLLKKAPRVVFASTGGAIYGGATTLPTPETYPAHPFSSYGIAKFASEEYLRAYTEMKKISAVSLRFANVYGPRQDPKSEAGVNAIFIQKLLRDEAPTIFGDGKQTRDFVYVDDIVQACLLAMKTDALGVYNIGTGVETSINELVSLMREEIGSKAKAIYSKARLGEEKRSALAFGLAKEKLGWQPTVKLEEGVKKTVVWFRTQKRGRA